MKRIDAGTSGSNAKPDPNAAWERLGLPTPWPAVARLLSGSTHARPVQRQALVDCKVLTTRRNLIVSAPTNSGKSLVGTLVLLDALRQGGRAVLVEPLRALAREKADEFERIGAELAEVLGQPVSVRVTTGDYRLDEEELSSPPPADAQLVIATPERLDAILRNPTYQPWVDSIQAVCVDEAHMVADRHRGPTLEFVVTAFLTQPAPPRVVLLSATMGALDDAKCWIAPCEVIHATDRQLQLLKEVFALEAGEDPNGVVVAEVKRALEYEGTSVLVFVYQTTSAVKVARDLTEKLGPLAGGRGALPYHAQMPSAQRRQVYDAYMTAASRVVVTTTALAMGVNLPATHVIVRDVTFFPEGRLQTGQLLQMLGRAGRGNRAGHGAVMIKPSDGRGPDELASELREEVLPAFRSALADGATGGGVDRREPPATRLVTALLARSQDMGAALPELEQFASRTLAGAEIAPEVAPTVEWLLDPGQLLAYRDDMDRVRMTKLGLIGARAALPTGITAGLGRLIRDLLFVEPDDRTISDWTALDSLLLVELLTPRMYKLRAFSEDLAKQVDHWTGKAGPDAPALFRGWISGSASTSKAAEVLGSLGIRPEGKGGAQQVARQFAYLAMHRTIVLRERSQGDLPSELEGRWKLKTGAFEGVEEQWRDTNLWLLSGLARILDKGSFHYHLRTECAADQERIGQLLKTFKRARKATFELMGELQRCSPLAPLLQAGRREGRRAALGMGMVKQLEQGGIGSLKELGAMTAVDLEGLGVNRKAAKVIVEFLGGKRRT